MLFRSFYQVKGGLAEGELVVTRGNFKIDSAIQLQAGPSMMNPYFDNAGPSDEAYPTLFISKLNLLNSIFAELSKAIHNENTAAIKSQLNNFITSLKSVDAEALNEDAKLIWQELSMLLGSDTILLAEADNSLDRRHIYVQFSEHFHGIRKHFNLNNVAATRAGSQVLQDKISKLVTQYLSLELLLAADDTDGAISTIKSLLPFSEDVVENLLQSGEELSSGIAVNLAKSNKQLAATKDLTTIRTAFYPLSQAIIKLVEKIGRASCRERVGRDV